jgi:hypothetical protein
MTRSDPLVQAGSIRAALGRAWTSWRAPAVPDYFPAPAPSARQLWLWRLDRIRDTLEQARVVLEQQRWTSGAWFTVQQASGQARLATTAEAFALRDPRRDVLGSCLVGTLVRLADDPDSAPSVPDVWVPARPDLRPPATPGTPADAHRLERRTRTDAGAGARPGGPRDRPDPRRPLRLTRPLKES